MRGIRMIRMYIWGWQTVPIEMITIRPRRATWICHTILFEVVTEMLHSVLRRSFYDDAVWFLAA